MLMALAPDDCLCALALSSVGALIFLNASSRSTQPRFASATTSPTDTQLQALGPTPSFGPSSAPAVPTDYNDHVRAVRTQGSGSAARPRRRRARRRQLGVRGQPVHAGETPERRGSRPGTRSRPLADR